MITNRTDRESLKDNVFGPCIFKESSNLESYKKSYQSENSSPSIQELSIISKQVSYGTKGKQKMQLAIMKAKQGWRKVSVSNAFKVSKIKLNDYKKQKQEQSFLKTMNQNSLIHKFKDNLLSSAYVLGAQQKQILESESYLQEKKEKHQVMRMIELNKTQGSSKKLTKLLMPGDNIVIFLDLLSLIVYLFSLWICPVKATFGQYNPILRGFELFINAYIIIEVVLTIYRPIIVQGEIISETNQIWTSYKQNQLLEDIMCITIWFMTYFHMNEVIILNEIMSLIQIVITVRKIARKYDSQIEYLYIKGFNRNLLDLITLLFFICFFAHMMACMWFYIGQNTSHYGSWLTFYNLVDENIWAKYNYSFYWATITLVTVGYGDITAKNQIEIAFVSIMVLVSNCMFAYTMNSIGVIVKSLYDEQNKFKRTLILMSQFMRKSQVDPKIQNRVKNYLKFNIENEILENNDETLKIMNNLPTGLKIELKQNINNNIIQKIKIVTDHFSLQTQNQVSQNLIQIKFTPQDIIYHRDERNDKHLYFISEGEVQIIEENSKKIIKQLKAGDTFGEYQFFTGQNTKESTISVGFTELYKIDRDKFQGFIKQNQKDFERFHKIKDVILYQKTFSIFLQKCSFCNKFNHQSIECPLLTYQPNIFIKMCRNNKLVNLREKFTRKNEKNNSFMLQNQVEKTIAEYQENMSISNDDEINEITNQISESDNINSQNEILVRKLSNEQIAKSINHELSQRSRKKLSLVQKENDRKPTILVQQSKDRIVQNELEKFTSKCNLSHKEQKQLDQYPSIQVQMDSDKFEILRNYQDYLPQNNVINVIRSTNREKSKSKLLPKTLNNRSFGQRGSKNQ